MPDAELVEIQTVLPVAAGAGIDGQLVLVNVRRNGIHDRSAARAVDGVLEVINHPMRLLCMEAVSVTAFVHQEKIMGAVDELRRTAAEHGLLVLAGIVHVNEGIADQISFHAASSGTARSGFGL